MILSFATITAALGDFVISNCEEGDYLDGTDCVPCPRGRYWEAGKCVACKPGTANFEEGSTDCIPRAFGTFAASPGSMVCSVCPIPLTSYDSIKCVQQYKPTNAPVEPYYQCDDLGCDDVVDIR